MSVSEFSEKGDCDYFIHYAPGFSATATATLPATVRTGAIPTA